MWHLVPYDTEEIDVGIVCGKIYKNNSGSMVQPQIFFELCKDSSTVIFGQGKVLIVPCSTVCGQQTPVTWPFYLRFCVIRPAEGNKIIISNHMKCENYLLFNTESIWPLLSLEIQLRSSPLSACSDSPKSWFDYTLNNGFTILFFPRHFCYLLLLIICKKICFCVIFLITNNNIWQTFVMFGVQHHSLFTKNKQTFLKN